MLTRAIFLCLLTAAQAQQDYSSFSVVGTICYPPDATPAQDKVTITTISPAAASQRVVMYDDQPESFDQAIRASGNCADQLKYAKMLTTKTGGDAHMVPGWSIANGGTFSETVTINQGKKRQWWVVVINCDNGTPQPVQLTSITIKDSGKASVPCSTMGQYSVAGYNWAIVLMSLAIIAAAVMAFLYWKKSQEGPSGDVGFEMN